VGQFVSQLPTAVSGAATIHTGPAFAMVRSQFEDVADHLEIPSDQRARLKVWTGPLS
jgi:hypothetical protein